MYQLRLLRFNNYNNRQIKQPDIRLTDTQKLNVYINYQILSCNNINFIPNDGITTEQVINGLGLLNTESIPNYCVVTNEVSGSEVIVSRWFILDIIRLRSGQHKLILKRDLIVDYYNDLLESTCFIERGMLDISDPYIFNGESLSFNQIKKNEYLLKDYTNKPWIVGYVARNFDQEVTFKLSNFYNYSVNELEDYENYQYFDTPNYNANYAQTRLFIPIKNEKLVGTEIETHCLRNSGPNYVTTYSDLYNNLTGRVYKYYGSSGNGNIVSDQSKLNSDIDRSLSMLIRNPSEFITPETLLLNEFNDSNILTNSKIEELLGEDGKIIKVGRNTYYKINATLGSIERRECETNGTAYTFVKNFVNYRNVYEDSYFNVERGYIHSDTVPYIEGSRCFCDLGSQPLYLTYEEISPLDEGTLTINFGSPRIHTKDSPYDIFCIPYATISASRTNIGSLERFTITEQNSLNVATGLGSLTDVVYDIQLLPYCPIINPSLTGDINLDDFYDFQDQYTMITEDNRDKYFILWASNSSFSFTKNYEIPAPQTAIDLKVKSETEFIRICSPNYNGIFEFNPYKNFNPYKSTCCGILNIDCTYKPFTPYIHINPDFDGLYGTNFRDARGLICSGDFSLATVKDVWVSYQINNKNFQNMFDREITNMGVSHKLNQTNAAISGTVGLGTKLATGNYLGAATSAISSGMQIATNQALYNEGVDYKKDMFSYQLDNIQALPNSITKISSLNYNNKIYPFIESYSCTTEESDGLKNIIKYTGMKIGKVVNRLFDFVSGYNNTSDVLGYNCNYIQGKIIRFPNVEISSKMLLELNSELASGLFIERYLTGGVIIPPGSEI